uniref:Uncharacterized protein n=1 Tax=Ciona savignyi TaxID=51511 RepID=H2YZI3_CIOSA
MLEILDTDLSCRSTEMIALKLQINSTFKGKDNSTYHGTVMPANVHLLSDYVSTIILGYTEDALDKCQAIVSLKAQLDRNYHHLVPAKLVLPKEPQFKHGIANNSWVDVDKLKLSRKDCIANLQVPKSVALQYAIMQYASDVRIDETWAGFLHHLLMEEQFLPPNPFPLLISHLRKSSMSVHTMFEADNIVVNRLLQNKIVVFDSTNSVYTINGTTAFGRRNALLFLSLKGFRQTSEISSQVAISPPGEAV